MQTFASSVRYRTQGFYAFVLRRFHNLSRLSHSALVTPRTPSSASWWRQRRSATGAPHASWSQLEPWLRVLRARDNALLVAPGDAARGQAHRPRQSPAHKESGNLRCVPGLSSSCRRPAPEPAAIGRDLIAQRYFNRKVRDPRLADKFVRHSQPKEDDTTSPPAPAATRS